MDLGFQQLDHGGEISCLGLQVLVVHLCQIEAGGCSRRHLQAGFIHHLFGQGHILFLGQKIFPGRHQVVTGLFILQFQVFLEKLFGDGRFFQLYAPHAYVGLAETTAENGNGQRHSQK